MKFKVIGADKHSGEDRELIIDAIDAQAASEQANSRGLMVADCTPLDVPDEPTRTCPFCAETINTKAIKCRWCGEMLNDASASSPPLPIGSVPMMKCPECRDDIPQSITACPRCGYPFSQQTAPLPASATCRLTVIVSIGKIWKFNLTKDAGSVELGGQVANGPAKSGFTCQFALSPGEHVVNTTMDGSFAGKYRINLPELGEYELVLGMKEMSGFGTVKLPVKRVK